MTQEGRNRARGIGPESNILHTNYISIMSGMHLSREFFELIKAIGESKSKQEEDRIIAREVLTLKKKLESGSAGSAGGGGMMIPGSPMMPGGQGGNQNVLNTNKKKAR